MRRVMLIISSIMITIMLVSGCSEESNNTVPVMQGQDISLLQSLVEDSKNITELYYEETPVVSHFSGGIKIENVARVWVKDEIIKTEQTTHYYKNDDLVDTQISGEIFDYGLFKTTRYYMGNYPYQVQSRDNHRDILIIPRDQTILWYMDRVGTEFSSIMELMHEGERCFVVEILKNQYGSTKVWISTVTGLPIKIENKYNNTISQREYVNFKIGKGSVSDLDLRIPDCALTY